MRLASSFFTVFFGLLDVFTAYRSCTSVMPMHPNQLPSHEGVAMQTLRACLNTHALRVYQGASTC